MKNKKMAGISHRTFWLFVKWVFCVCVTSLLPGVIFRPFVKSINCQIIHYDLDFVIYSCALFIYAILGNFVSV